MSWTTGRRGGGRCCDTASVLGARRRRRARVSGARSITVARVSSAGQDPSGARPRLTLRKSRLHGRHRPPRCGLSAPCLEDAPPRPADRSGADRARAVPRLYRPEPAPGAGPSRGVRPLDVDARGGRASRGGCVRRPRRGLPVGAVRRVPDQPCGRGLLQGPRILSSLWRPPHGAERRELGRGPVPPGPGPPVGAVAADGPAPRAGLAPQAGVGGAGDLDRARRRVLPAPGGRSPGQRDGDPALRLDAELERPLSRPVRRRELVRRRGRRGAVPFDQPADIGRRVDGGRGGGRGSGAPDPRASRGRAGARRRAAGAGAGVADEPLGVRPVMVAGGVAQAGRAPTAAARGGAGGVVRVDEPARGGSGGGEGPRRPGEDLSVRTRPGRKDLRWRFPGCSCCRTTACR